MRKTIIWLLVIALTVTMAFMEMACKSITVAETTAVETTAVGTTSAQTISETAASASETTTAETTTETEIINYCNNSYFPIKENTIWNYNEKTSQNEPVEYSVSFKEVKENSFTKIVTTPYSTTETKWSCNEKGLIQTEPTQMNFTDSVLFIYEFDTTGVEGITFPPENEMKVGKSWKTSYEAKIKMGVGDKVETATVKIEIENKIISIESVKVPSGNYPEALKVASTMTTNISMDAGKTPTGISNSDSWFVKDIGLVKQVCKSDNSTATIELLSME